MLSRQRVSLAVIAVAAAVAATSWSPAWAEVGPPPVTEGGTITVTVTGTGVRGGTAGRTATRSIQVPSPCSMSPGFTGKEYYEWVESGDAASDHRRTGGEGQFEPRPNYEQYKDDDEGHWYGGMCSSEGFDDLDEFFEYADNFFAENPAIYIPVGQPVPTPPIPPALLRDVAMDALTLPTPAIDWNPKRAGDAATLVNLDTWVWLQDRRDALWVEASVNSLAGRISARVDATMTEMTVSAPGATGATCANPGVPYAPGATGQCSIRFTRSSAALGGATTPVTVQTQWHATWSANGEDQGDVPVQPDGQSQVTQVGVGEVQAVNRDPNG